MHLPRCGKSIPGSPPHGLFSFFLRPRLFRAFARKRLGGLRPGPALRALLALGLGGSYVPGTPWILV